jgi:ribonuclease E
VTETAAAPEAAAPEGDAVEAPAKKAAAKKAPAKKAATKKSAAKKAEPEAPATEAAVETPAEKPAKRTRSRKATEVPQFSAVVDETVAPEAPAAPAAGMLMFQAPSADAPPARKRAAKKAAAPVVEEPVVEDEEIEVDADAETEADAESVDAEENEGGSTAARRRRRRGGRGRRRRAGEDGESAEGDETDDSEQGETDADASGTTEESDDSEDGDRSEGGSSRRRRRRRRGGSGDGADSDDPPNTVVRVREPRQRSASSEVTSVKGSTRLEAKKQRRREGREAGRRRPSILTEAEFLARREAVERVMVVRQRDDRTQIAVLEDGVLVEHYVNRNNGASMIGNVYLGKVQNVLPSMEAAFVDIGRGRNAVLYAGEVNWDAAGLEGQPKRIEAALKPGDPVLVQVSKDPLGHKGARLTAQISLPGRFVVYVPEGQMTGISRKLPDAERSRLKAILRQVVPEDAGVIVRTAAEGAAEEELRRDVERLAEQWTQIQEKVASAGGGPALLHGEPDLAIKVVRDIFNEDFTQLLVEGSEIAETLTEYVAGVAPDLAERVRPWVGPGDLFREMRIDEQLAKALDRKVWLPSGGSLVIDRTEAMTVVDVNTGKFTGQGGNLEETVTRNNLEAAEEIVRQLRLRDIGGIIVVDFIDMVLESNRDLVLRRLVECLGRDRTKHQVAEVTSLGLVQMTRKRIGQGLLEVFSETCEACQGRGYHVHSEPVAAKATAGEAEAETSTAGSRSRKRKGSSSDSEGGGRKSRASAAAAPEVEPRVIDPKVTEAMEKVHAAAAKRAADAAAAAAAEASAAVAEDQAHHAEEAPTAPSEAPEAPQDAPEAPAAASTPAPRKRGPRKATRKAGPASAG